MEWRRQISKLAELNDIGLSVCRISFFRTRKISLNQRNQEPTWLWSCPFARERFNPSPNVDIFNANLDYAGIKGRMKKGKEKKEEEEVRNQHARINQEIYYI